MDPDCWEEGTGTAALLSHYLKALSIKVPGGYAYCSMYARLGLGVHNSAGTPITQPWKPP